MTESLGFQLTDKSTLREEIQTRINRLKLIDSVKYAALPLVAIGAGVGLVIPVAFPAIAVSTAVFVGAADLFARKERKIIDREIETFKNSFDVPASEVTALSSSANNVTVFGSSS